MTQAPEAQETLVVRTRFVPPKLRRQIIARPRVDAALARAVEFPLTVVKAEAGYGKTTAVAAWVAQSGLAHVWYNVGDTEADPQLFLLHLIEALRTAHPAVGVRSLALLNRDERSPRVWNAAVDALSNDLLDALAADTVLVLDDYDRANRAEVNAITERLVETMPPLLHLVITARTMPSLRSRARWRASGEMLEVSRAELAFNAGEVTSLFTERLQQPLSAEAAQAVTAETEGWPIALQMLSDGLGPAHADALDDLLQRIPGPAELLFDYLADEVFLRQSPDVRRFLGESALLRRLDPDACDHALEAAESAELLRSLEQRSLFVTFDGVFRYHNLFRDFLRRRAGVSSERRAEVHRRAASHYDARGEREEAVYHLIAAGEHARAAELLTQIARAMAESGRHRALGAWLDQLPAAVLERSPELLFARAETCRLTSRYADAVPAYLRARAQFRAMGDVSGEVRAIRGHALVFLDTVQPALAEPLLREALQMTRGDRNERVALALLLAENTLNAGALRRAERLYRAAHRMAQHPEAPLDPRVFAREGRLDEGRRVVEANLRVEPVAAVRARAPRSHREPAALLAWMDALVGEADGARQHAAESLEIGQALGSPVVECIALSRLGLAWLCGRDHDAGRARGYFDESLRMAERVGVSRFRVESLIGMTILHGLSGDAERAEATGREGIAIVESAGDRYIRGVICLAIGGALTLASHPRAEEWLNEATRQAVANGDRFTPCIAAIWQAVLQRNAASTTARDSLVRALDLARHYGYGFLFEGTALLAPKDLSLLRSMLSRAFDSADAGEYARKLSARLEDAESPVNGGSTEGASTAPLYIQTFGAFRVWRNGQEIERSAWAREKALHLLQLLVVNRDRMMHREEILEALWHESTAPTAATGLRVALSALRSALEPDRESGSDGAYIRRDGDAIRLAADPAVRVDADELTRLVKAAAQSGATDVELAISRYESALTLYRGEFLAENRYAKWAEAERQRKRAEFLAAGERLGRLLLKTGDYERAARWAEAILAQDPLWEGAYAVLMEALWRQGNRALAVRAYNRCRKRLRESLGVSPSARITELLDKVAAAER